MNGFTPFPGKKSKREGAWKKEGQAIAALSLTEGRKGGETTGTYPLLRIKQECRSRSEIRPRRSASGVG